MPADFWPNAWFALGVTLVAIVPVAVVIAVDAAGLRRRPRTALPEHLSRGGSVFSMAFGAALLSGVAAWVVGWVGFTAFSGPEGEPVHIGEITEVESCSRNGVALALVYECDIWVEAPTLPEGEIDRFRTIITSAVDLEPGDPAGLWPGEETGDGRMIWDVHPMSQTERPHLEPGRNAAPISTAALAAVVMVVWSRLRPVPFGRGESFLDDWGSEGGGDTGGGDGGGGD